MGAGVQAFKWENDWWESAGNTSLYEVKDEVAGFVLVDQPRRAGLIVMAFGRTAQPNHAGIYLGDDPALPGEGSDVFGLGPFLLHHLYGRPSEVIVYDGSWRDRTRFMLTYQGRP